MHDPDLDTKAALEAAIASAQTALARAAAEARLAEAQADVERLRAKLAAEHAASKNAQLDDEPTGRAVTAQDGRKAARRRFAKDAATGTDTPQDSAAAGRAAAAARFRSRS